MENQKQIDKLFEDKKEHTIKLTKKQIGSLCSKLYTDIEDCRYILDNYEQIEEKELSKEEIKTRIEENKITIEKLINTHFPIFEWVISD